MIEMHYVGIDSSETAKKRIAERVKMGGHGIPDRDVEKRYEESLINLGKVLPLCDLAAIYDNTSRFRRFAIFKNRKETLCQRLRSCFVKAVTFRTADWKPGTKRPQNQSVTIIYLNKRIPY
mgnify:CR=1 FL=1